MILQAGLTFGNVIAFVIIVIKRVHVYIATT